MHGPQVSIPSTKAKKGEQKEQKGEKRGVRGEGQSLHKPAHSSSSQIHKRTKEITPCPVPLLPLTTVTSVLADMKLLHMSMSPQLSTQSQGLPAQSCWQNTHDVTAQIPAPATVLERTVSHHFTSSLAIGSLARPILHLQTTMVTWAVLLQYS